MEHIVLKDQHGKQIGLFPILADDFDATLEKAKKRAKLKANPFCQVTIYHRTQDKWSENCTPIMSVKDR